MPTPELLDRLLRTPGPSGHESAPARVWREAVAGFSDDVRADRVGSSLVRVPGTAGGPSLLVIGHVDEIGIRITHIEDEGLLRFGEVGGWDPIQLIGQRIRVATRGGDVVGVIGRAPIHVLDRAADKPPKIKELTLDIGAADGEEARSLVRIGDVGVIDVAPIELRGERIASRSLDNRIGAYVAAEAARLVAQAGGAPGDVYGAAVAQEEITFAGARTTAFVLEPDVAIAVDVTQATDQPGVEVGQVTHHKLGSGPVISRGLTLHPAISELLIETAEALGMDYTLESEGRGTGTDADAVHASRAGVATGVISVPLRYMHSAVEVADLRDVQRAAELIAAAAQRLDGDFSLER